MPETIFAKSGSSSPDFLCAVHMEMRRYWEIVDDVRKGTLHMRECEKRYMPKHPLESNRAYENRLKATVFFNAYEHTLGGLVGMIFRQNPVLGDDVPKAIKGTVNDEGKTKRDGYVENIDMQGNHFDVFARELCMDAFDGHVFLHVEMPKKPQTGDNAAGVVTLADEQQAGMRPYFTKYRAQDALNWRTEIVNGKVKLQQITFRECNYERDGLYGEKLVTRYRVLTPGKWELFKEQADGKGKVEIVPDDEGVTSLAEIPVAVIYGRKLGYMFSRPPLIDLAHLNISHWQLSSDYRHILHYANVPILWRAGYRQGDQSGAEGIGPNRIWDVGENGKVAWAEHHGWAIGDARKELLDTEQRMSVLGLSLLARKGDSDVTATEKILDTAEQSSALGTIARSLQDGLESGLGFMAQYMDEKSGGGSVTVNDDFHGLSLDPQKLTIYSQMVGSGQLSIETLWDMMERYGELPDDFNAVKEKERLDATINNPNNLPPPGAPGADNLSRSEQVDGKHVPTRTARLTEEDVLRDKQAKNY